MSKEILSKSQIIDLLYSYNFNYYVEINDAVKSLFTARHIIRKYIKTQDIKDKLLINSIIIANNILGIKLTNVAIYNIFNDEEYKYIKAVLVFLNIYDNNYGDNFEVDIHLINLFNDTLNRYQKQGY